MPSNSSLSGTSTQKLIDVVDVHVGGDVHRIVVGGIRELPGSSVLEQMDFLKKNADGLRKLLLHEPRGGHPSLFADLVVKPMHPRAHAGFIIMELMGYPLISGTNTMSTAIALLETGRLPLHDGLNEIVLEAPGGLIDVQALSEHGKVNSVTYQAACPSYVAATDLVANVPNLGAIRFDVIWTGAFYPVISASTFGFTLVRDDEDALVRFAREFLVEARKAFTPIHPKFGDEGPLSFVVFAGTPEKARSGALECRVCCYEYPRKSVCRAPAGIPSTAVLVQLLHRNMIRRGETLRTISIFDTDLHAKVVNIAEYYGFNGVEVAVTGRGWITTKAQIVVDFSDPLTPHEGLNDILTR